MYRGSGSEVAYNYIENQVLLYGSLYHDVILWLIDVLAVFVRREVDDRSRDGPKVHNVWPVVVTTT